jgi:Domain of unknown function (DUF1906)
VEYHFWLYWFQLPFIISAGKWEDQMIVDASLGFLNNVPLLTKNNIDTIGRYFCQDQTEEKFLKPDEARQIAQANIRLFTIFEQAVDLTSGVAHANCALDCAKAIGQPAQSAIYFGIEKNGGFTKADMGQITTYFADIKKTIAGQFKIGIYSNGTPCRVLKAAGSVDYTWLAAASYSHDGTWDFYTSGLWTLAQVGPLDINTNLIPGSWPHMKNPWTLDVNIPNGQFGSFIANPPPANAPV